MINKSIIIIVLLLCSLQLVYSQSDTSRATNVRAKCYSRDRRFYLEYLSLMPDSTFIHEAWLGDQLLATGHWKQVGDSLYLTYNHADSTQTLSPRLGIYQKYFIKRESLLPVTPGKKGRLQLRTRWSEVWMRGKCVDIAP